MSKSQNTRSEQQKDLCIKSEQLTEQWKNWQLEGFRWYYVKFKTGDIDICWLTEWSNDELGTGGQYFDGIEDEKVLEVLAPVPSYDEWKASEKYNKHLEEKIKIYERKDKQATETSIAYNELAKENDKLKTENKWYSEQLKEAVKEISQLKEIIEKDKKVFAESRIYPTHLISEDFPVKYDIDRLKELLKECKQWFDWYHIDTGTGKEYIESWHKKGYEIHAKIDEVLR